MASGGGVARRRAAVVAGAALAAMALVAGPANFLALGPVTGAQSAADLTAAVDAGALLARVGVLGMLLVVVLDVVVAIALHAFLAPVAPQLARLVAWLRVAYAAGFLVALGWLVVALDAAGTDPATGLAGLRAYDTLWQVSLIVFGAHLLALAATLLLAGQGPRWLALLVGVAGAGYVADGAATVLGGRLQVSAVTFAGEVVLLVWLLVRAGRRP